MRLFPSSNIRSELRRYCTKGMKASTLHVHSIHPSSNSSRMYYYEFVMAPGAGHSVSHQAQDAEWIGGQLSNHVFFICFRQNIPSPPGFQVEAPHYFHAGVLRVSERSAQGFKGLGGDRGRCWRSCFGIYLSIGVRNTSGSLSLAVWAFADLYTSEP